MGLQGRHGTLQAVTHLGCTVWCSIPCDSVDGAKLTTDDFPQVISLHLGAAYDILQRRLSSTEDSPIREAGSKIAEVVLVCRRLTGVANLVYGDILEEALERLGASAELIVINTPVVPSCSTEESVEEETARALDLRIIFHAALICCAPHLPEATGRSPSWAESVLRDLVSSASGKVPCPLRPQAVRISWLVKLKYFHVASSELGPEQTVHPTASHTRSPGLRS